jgi:DNA polymerase-3 subunit epsilon/oligoribonuclease
MYWALNLKTSNKFAGFSKDQIAKSLNLPPEEKPHKAINGVNHLILCYKHLVGFPKS